MPLRCSRNNTITRVFALSVASVLIVCFAYGATAPMGTPRLEGIDVCGEKDPESERSGSNISNSVSGSCDDVYF